MPLAHVNGTSLFYREVGEGEPCLLMHGGFGLDHTCMSPLLDSLASNLRMVYYDHRGNGRSSREGVETMTYEDLTDDADALRATILKADQTSVIASSGGCFVAMQYALRYPERVRRLILIGGAPAYAYFDEVRAGIAQRGGPDASAQVEVLVATPKTDDAWTEYKYRVLGPLYFHSDDKSLTERVLGRTVWSGVADKRGRELSGGPVDRLDGFTGLDLRDRLPQLRVPTLIIVGRHDFITPPSQSELLHRSIQRSQLVVFEESGHFPYVEEPLAFTETVRRWLASA